MVAKRTVKVATPNRPPPQNLLLAALPTADRERIQPLLDVIPLKLKHMLHRPGESFDYVYFPAGGFCSVVTVLEDGSMVEVATIGREGMVGVSALIDGQPVVSATMVQGATEVCYRMSAASFRAEFEKRGAFYTLLSRYSQALTDSIMQSTACNAVHSIEQRLARWLLMAQDRMGGSEFPLTQEFLAMMLGATRPTVTVVAGSLQRAGLISYRRGQVKVRNRAKLEAASCECYKTTTRVLRRVTNGSASALPREAARTSARRNG
jgi:CRP-like cAMP-binding protein